MMYECCQKPENRKVIEQDEQRTVEQCVCGRKHYTLNAPPIEVGVKGASLDGGA